jgi:hypothetical protein
MKSDKPKIPKRLRPEELFLSTYTDEVLQSALERSARVHPPLYQCKYCQLQFKELTSFAPHTKFYADKGYCRSVAQITARGRFKQITYTDDFFIKKHTCITVNPRYDPNSDNELIQELSKIYDVDTIKKDYDPDDFEYRPLQSHWSEPDPQTGEVFMEHPNEYHKYHLAIQKADEDRKQEQANQPVNETKSFQKMIDHWMDASQSSALDDQDKTLPIGMPGQMSYADYYQTIKDMKWQELANLNQLLRNQK